MPRLVAAAGRDPTGVYPLISGLLKVSVAQPEIASKRGFVTAGSDHFHADNTIRFDDQSIVEIVNRGADVARDQV